MEQPLSSFKELGKLGTKSSQTLHEMRMQSRMVISEGALKFNVQ